MRRLRVIFLWTAIVGSSIALVRGSADAQEAVAAPEPAGYREAIEQALAEYAASNYEEASTLFARAHELSPNARTLRGLGMAAFELRRYEESVQHLEHALGEERRPLEGELRAETEALLARARGFVARVTIDLTPESASLAIDGNPVASPAPMPLLLRLGEHVVEARAEGYKPGRREIRVRGGEVLRMGLELERDLLAAPPPIEREPRRLVKNPWLWTAVGAVVAGGAVAGVLLATRDRTETRTVPIGSEYSQSGISLTSSR